MADLTYQKIKESGELPSPSGVALRLLQLADDETSTIEQVTSTVESDPAIASRLLKLVNSPLSGVSRTVASVSMAVKLLGLHTVKNLALGFSLLSSNRQGASKTFDYERFWSESLARAVVARNLSGFFKCCAPDEAFTFALLSGVGRLALATAFPKEYDQLLTQLTDDSPTSLVEAEQKIFQTDHNHLAAAMMADWHLADVFCESVRNQDAIDQTVSDDDSRVTNMVHLLQLSGQTASVLVKPNVYREDMADLLKMADRLGIAAEVFTDRYEVIRAEWQDIAGIFSVRASETPSLREAHVRASRGLAQVLVVDDDSSMLQLLRTYLEEAGYEVLTASHGKDALKVIRTEGCKLVITDWMMPEMDGLTLCRAVHEAEALGHMYIIVLTAQFDADILTRAFEAGADDCLVKPCEKQELLARLKAGVRALQTEAKVVAQQLAIRKSNAELSVLNEKLQLMATTDELTGLYNRREAIHRLEEYWMFAERQGRSLACMMFDIDHFKQCNDRCGHDIGDAVLMETARTLKRFLRAGETVYRIGGEEFVVYCPGSGAKAAAKGAERLRAAVEANIIRRGDLTLSVTISAGVAERSEDTLKPDDLLRLADEALYAAKREGRNQVHVAGVGGTIVPHLSRQTESPLGPPPSDVSSCLEGTPSTVLIVDDDKDARYLFRKLLEREGFQVQEACDGVEALTRAADVHPHVVLMDVDMPNMNGFECTRRLKADPALCHIPVIIVSARSGNRDVHAGLQAGAQEYITKPIQHDEFLLRVRVVTQLCRHQAKLLESNAVRGEQARAMSVLFELSRTLAVVDSLDAIVTHTVSATAELLNSRRVSVMLPDETGEHLYIASAIGIEDALAARILVPVGSEISGSVFASGQSVVFNTPQDAVDRTGRYDSNFFASVPLASKALAVPNKVVGVLNVTERHDRLPFEAHEMEYLDLVCRMAASVMEQFQSGRAREHAHAAIVIGLAKLAEHRDANTGKHLERVTRYALELAGELRKTSRYASTIDDTFLAYLERATPLHDVGKVSVPDAILLKRGPLSREEFSLMKRHAVVGAQAIQSMIEQAPEAGFLLMARDIACGHHERFDGSGYPKGVTGEDIPLSARIVAVADVYDALTSKRPYKEAFPHEQSVEIIRGESGSHFDPAVVEAFLHLETRFAELARELRDDGETSGETMTGRELAGYATEAAACPTQ